MPGRTRARSPWAGRARAVVAVAVLAAVSTVTACSSGSGKEADGTSPTSAERPSPSTSALPACGSARHLVATDIDETLTVSDGELVKALGDPGYEPKARPGGAAMMRDYVRRGYTIAYVTGRPVSMSIGGVPAEESTTRWLEDQGFPLGPGVGIVYLWPTERYRDIRTYKAAVLDDLEREGYELDYAYGNADTDAQAFADAGFAKDRTFMIGKLAGYGGTVAVRDPGWVAHRREFVDDLPAVCHR